MSERVHALNLGGWSLLAELVRNDTLPLADIAKAARCQADSYHGDQVHFINYVLSVIMDGKDVHGNSLGERFAAMCRVAGLLPATKNPRTTDKDIIASTEWHGPNPPAFWLQLIQEYIGTGLLKDTDGVMLELILDDTGAENEIVGSVGELIDTLKAMNGDWSIIDEDGWVEPVVQLGVVRSEINPSSLLVITDTGMGYDEDDDEH